jgi:hypothetical protein
MPTPTYYPIATLSAPGNSTEMQISNLGGYQHLLIVMHYKFSNAGNYVYLNTSTTTQHPIQWVYANTTTTANELITQDNYIRLNPTGNLNSVWGVSRIFVPNYGETSTFKSFFVETGWKTSFNIGLGAGHIKSTSAITSVKHVSGSNFDAGSTITAYGFNG